MACGPVVSVQVYRSVMLFVVVVTVVDCVLMLVNEVIFTSVTVRLLASCVCRHLVSCLSAVGLQRMRAWVGDLQSALHSPCMLTMGVAGHCLS